jgi:Uma2 family endonuclease
MAGILERPAAPTRHRLDVDAYYKMAEAGVLPADCRVELIDGDIIDMTPIGSAHAGNTNRLIESFARATAAGQALLTVQTPLRLDAYNEPQPDVMLLRPRPDHYKARHPSPADVLLLVEVSDSSVAYDRNTKLALYARFGVPEVWIVDIPGGGVEIYREPKEGAYARRERLVGGELSPALVPQLTIDVAWLLA